MQFTVILHTTKDFHTTKENRVCKMQEWINGYVTKSVVKVIIKSPRLVGFLSVVHAFIKMVILFTSYHFFLVPLCPAGFTGKYCNNPCHFQTMDMVANSSAYVPEDFAVFPPVAQK